jgi:hypothetical protein
MSRWTHAICAPCWNRQHPDRPVETTTRIVEEYRAEEACCFCGERTSAGIYVRHDPEETACKGVHQ